MICAGYEAGTPNPCHGDSGGPMTILETQVLIGIVSWGTECGKPNFPEVFARVSRARNWINIYTDV